jgi:hemolysin III
MRSIDREEAASALTHAVGLLAGAAGGTLLLIRAARSGSAWSIVGAAVFVAALLLLYSASTLYHAARADEPRRRLQVLDHSAIYVLIAGTYTPFMLGPLRGGWGWSLFGVIWGLALAGVIFKLFFTGRFRGVSTGLYIAMGWLVVIGVVPLVRALEPAALGWLVAGGIAYTGGTIFYLSDRMPFGHAVWHLFVLAGTACHGVAVALQM